jgi:serine/threonine protein phosphatase 1
MRIYAIGDIHGQLEMLHDAHKKIAADREACGDHTALVVHLGDYTDRGLDSAKVIQTLIDGQKAGEPWKMIKGNHDRMFHGFVEDKEHNDSRLPSHLSWLHPRLGGIETLASYGIEGGGTRHPLDLHREAKDKVPQAHRDFLNTLPLLHETDDLLFVHAGIRPGIAIQDQAEDDLVWIRDGFLEDDTDHGKLVVHGHTALDEPTHFGNRVDIDTGAGYFRPLTVAVFEDRDCWVLTDQGRVALRPFTV